MTTTQSATAAPGSRRPMEFVYELLDAIEQRYAPLENQPRHLKQRVLVLRRTAKQIASALHIPFELVRIDDLLEIDATLSDYMKTSGASKESTRQSVVFKNALIGYALDLNWNTPLAKLIRAWIPISRAMSSRKVIFPKFVLHFIRKGRFPSALTTEEFEKYSGDTPGLSVIRIDQQKATFRRAIQRAKLSRLVPKVKFRGRRRRHYALPWKKLPSRLVRQIRRIVSTLVKNGALRASSGHEVLAVLRQLSSYAVVYRHMRRVNDLAKIITEQVIYGWIDFLRKVRKCTPRTVLTALSRILSVTKHIRRYRRVHRLICIRANSLPKERNWVARQRKREKLVHPDLYDEIPENIRAERTSKRDLSPVQNARLMHDELFFRWVPVRLSNQAGCSLDPSASVTVIKKEITDSFKARIQHFPPDIEKLWRRNKRKEFWLCHIREVSSKNKSEIIEVLPSKVASLLVHFRRVRPLLLKKKSHQHLFMNEKGGVLRPGAVRNLMKRITTKYLPKPISHHRRRDYAAIAAVLAGATIQEVGGRLGQRSLQSTITYLAGLDFSGATELLEKHFAKIGLKAV